MSVRVQPQARVSRPTGALTVVAHFLLLALTAACGGSGSGVATDPLPPPTANTVTIRYLRVEPAYAGWGLHLWGSAIDASVATQWNTPRTYNRVENGQAIFEIPIVDASQALNFIAHNGDLKSPVYDLSIVPQSFGREVWIVQDETAAVSNGIGVPFSNAADALNALSMLGNKSVSLDLSSVVVNDVDSGLPADWPERASFMEIYVRGYQDSDGDGIGDIQGLISRLDYLQSLGVTGLWLMPVTESADNDHGYAVEDYRDIEDDYGTLADFEQLLSEAHARDIGIIIDYVLNHSASSNPLFLDASTSSSNGKRDWYLWEDAKPGGWNTFAGDPWRNNGNGWYYGIFSPLMPDFNLRNPDVMNFHMDNLRFWLNKGVDGFRFDAVGVLFENGAGDWEDQPENHLFLQGTRTLVAQYLKRYLVCEAPSMPAAYAVDSSCGRAFAFQVPGAILNSARDGVAATAFVDQLRLANTGRMPLFLSNHDSFAGARSWSQLDGEIAQLKLAAASYLLAADTPFVYYGEEVGMANAAVLSGDHALRTPMSWSGDSLSAGFSTVPPFRELAANSQTNNVELQTPDSDSLLNYYRHLLGLRNSHTVIAKGTLEVQSDGGDPVLVLTRSMTTEVAVIAINFSTQSRNVMAQTNVNNALFEAVFGASGSASSDGAGILSLAVPAQSTVVYHR